MAPALLLEIGRFIHKDGLFAANHSGGKESQARLIHLREVGILPAQMVVIHAPLGRVDRPGPLEPIRATVSDLPLIPTPAWRRPRLPADGVASEREIGHMRRPTRVPLADLLAD